MICAQCSHPKHRHLLGKCSVGTCACDRKAKREVVTLTTEFMSASYASDLIAKLQADNAKLVADNQRLTTETWNLGTRADEADEAAFDALAARDASWRMRRAAEADAAALRKALMQAHNRQCDRSHPDPDQRSATCSMCDALAVDAGKDLLESHVGEIARLVTERDEERKALKAKVALLRQSLSIEVDEHHDITQCQAGRGGMCSSHRALTLTESDLPALPVLSDNHLLRRMLEEIQSRAEKLGEKVDRLQRKVDAVLLEVQASRCLCSPSNPVCLRCSLRAFLEG